MLPLCFKVLSAIVILLTLTVRQIPHSDMRGGTIKLGPGARPGNVHLQLSLFTSWNLRRLALLDPASMIGLKKR